MKNIKQGIIGAFALLLASSVHTFAIEGLQIAVKCRDVVLSWPSDEFSGETYIVQYRVDLTSTNPWTTLTNYMPPDAGTNLTFFVHSNIVQYPNCGGSASSSMMMAASMTSRSPQSLALRAAARAERMAQLTNDLALIMPPLQVTRAKFKRGAVQTSASETVRGVALGETSAEEAGGPLPPGGSGAGGGSSFVPETGFYRVVRNGVHLFGITNGMVLKGVVDVPIEIAVDSADQIAGTSFYADGTPLIGAGSEDFRMMEWNTSMMPNGTYNLNAEVDFNSDDPVSGPPVTVTVSNLVSFPNYFARIYGDQMWLYAELAILHADYEIKMYADETNYIGSFSGSTTDGTISFLWDLTDGGNHTFTNVTFRGDFYITPTATANNPLPPGGGTPAGTQTWAQEYGWSGEGNFTVAWCRPTTIPQDAIKANLMVAEGVVDVLANFYTLSPGNPQYSDTAYQVYDGYTKTNLLTTLADLNYRNFYFFGHGSPYTIGGIPPDPTITYRDISHRLGNFFITRRPFDYHPYRFVFIDGCNTGKAGFCEAFGIPAQTLNNAFFAAANVRSRAFLGFKGAVTFNSAQWQYRAYMLQSFFVQWITGTSLNNCVNNAVNNTLSPLDSSWVIYGATDLKRGVQ